MKIRNLTSDGDWRFGKGLQSYLTAQDAIALDIKTYLKLWTGNCFFALQAGVNWRQYLDKNQKQRLLAGLQTAIMGRFGVMSLTQLSAVLDRNSRVMVVRYTVTTIYTQSFQDSITIGASNA
jgi:hypothetical protein